MKHFSFLFSLFLIYIAKSIQAQTGSLDTSFNTTGIVTTQIGTLADYIYSLAVQSDGKIIAAGESFSNEGDIVALARYNPDGSLDSTFNEDGIITIPSEIMLGAITDLKIMQDGKILAVGLVYDDPVYDMAILRFNTDGTLDNTFCDEGIRIVSINSNGTMTTCLALQPDNKILIAGYSFISHNYDFILVRLNQDGTFDSSLDNDGILNTSFIIQETHCASNANSIAIQSDGKIVLAGSVGDPSGDTDFALARYKTNGTLDPTFGNGGKVITRLGSGSDVIRRIEIQSDNKIICAGYSYINKLGFAFVRYNQDGTVDTSFGEDGLVFTDLDTDGSMCNSFGIQPDGKIIAGGMADNGNDQNFALARFNNNGSLDNSFGNNGILIQAITSGDDGIRSLKIQPDERIVAGGFSHIVDYDYEFALIRVLSGLIVNTLDFSIQNILLIYPNPVNQNTTLEYTLDSPEELTLQLYDMQGKKQYTLFENRQYKAGTHTQPLTIPENMPSGNYLLVLFSSHGKASIKITK
jgi:uncharacterized delta-60 repeat protein